MTLKANIDLGTMSLNKKGDKMFTTRYSNWDCIEFKSREEAEAFGKGCICTLRFKWKDAAIAMRFENKPTEYFD